MLVLLLSLITPALASASLLDGRTVLPHCQFLDVKVPEECRAELPPDALDLVLPVANRVVRDEQLRQIRAFTKDRMLAELNTSIESRKILLTCLDAPAGEGCEMRVKALRTALEQNIRRLRLALVLSKIPSERRDRSLDRYVQLPAPLGAGHLEPLSEEELAFARNFQKSSLGALERVGVSKLRQELGLSLSEEQLRAKCRALDPNFHEACLRLEEIHYNSFEQFRGSMRKISEALISSLPLTVRFKNAPVTDAQLKKELTDSLKALEEWRLSVTNSNGRAEEERITSELPLVDEYVALHPEACAAAEDEIRSLNYRKLGRSVVTTGKNVVLMSTLCAVSTPLVCFSVGTGLSALGARGKFVEWNRVRSRFTSADRGNVQANLAKAQDNYRDFLVTAALGTVGTVMGLQGLLQPGGTAQTALQELEKRPFFQDAGQLFDKIAHESFEGVKGATISKAAESAVEELSANDPTTTYRDWLRSDASTARIYEFFVLSLSRR